MKTTIRLFLAFLCLSAAGPKALAVSPPPDGGYPGGNTAEGQNALFSLTSGTYNTAVGYLSLRSDMTGSFNTAVGAGTLLANTANSNTATGVAALLSNTAGTSNTANGAFALLHNTDGFWNTATGDHALSSNTTGDSNTANGLQALTANTEGIRNTAVGVGALQVNVAGSANTGIGAQALHDSIGANNTAVGTSAGFQITGSGNICIGSGVTGVAGDNNTIRIGDNLPNGSACYIGGIFNELVVGGDTVICNSAGKVGTGTSSKRFKEAIKPMDTASEAILALTPVTFRYKKELDPAGRSQFGLVAEDVEKVNPDLVVHDKYGKPHGVRYDQVNAMLLNEFLKEHRTVQEQKATIAELKSGMKALAETVKEQTAQIHKVSAQLAAASPSGGGLEQSSPARQLVNNP